MARRSKAGSTAGLLFLLIVGAVIAVIKNIVDSTGGTTVVVLLLAAIATVVFLAWHRKKKRFEALFKKYGDADIAKRGWLHLLTGDIGQTVAASLQAPTLLPSRWI